jgi:hypothetical protein
VPGYPIRTPSDLSSVDSSPRLIAASYVLHRLLMPRHPPCALNNLTTKMLASTVQFSNNHPPYPSTTEHQTKQRLRYASRRDPGPPRQRHPHTGERVFSQDPTVCQTTSPIQPHTRVPRTPKDPVQTSAAPQSGLHSASSSTLMSNQPPSRSDSALLVLLRKEVIQPHLPVRLPCYDFVPIASPTFDHSPPYGLGHGLRVLPTFVT